MREVVCVSGVCMLSIASGKHIMKIGRAVSMLKIGGRRFHYEDRRAVSMLKIGEPFQC